MPAEPTVTPGIYRHFKGGRYEVIGTARHSETEDLMVVYRAHSGSAELWVRPASMFTEQVLVDGELVARFERIESDEPMTSSEG